MHFTSPWNSSFSFSGIRSCPITCRVRKKTGREKITCKENKKYYINNRPLQEKSQMHEPSAIWEVSKSQSSCILKQMGRTESPTFTTAQPHPASGYACIFTLWLAAETSMLTLCSVLTLQVHRHPDLLLGVAGPREARREVFSPQAFPNPEMVCTLLPSYGWNPTRLAADWVAFHKLKAAILTAKLESCWRPSVP